MNGMTPSWTRQNQGSGMAYPATGVDSNFSTSPGGGGGGGDWGGDD